MGHGFAPDPLCPLSFAIPHIGAWVVQAQTHARSYSRTYPQARRARVRQFQLMKAKEKKWPESKRRCPPTASSIMTRRGDERSLYHLHFAANAPLSFFLSLSLPFLLFFLSFRCCLQSVRRRTYALLLGPLCSYR